MRGSEKVGFIGAGNMATAIIKGLIQSRTYLPDQLTTSDKSDNALKIISDKFGIMTMANRDLVSTCSTVVLSIKPQNMREVLEEIRGKLTGKHLVISIAAGIPLKMIHSIIGRDIPLIRVMPNTPALVQKGISVLARGQWAEDEHMSTAKNIFNAVGNTIEVKEDLMDAVTALSGSGPGYVFRIMECMVSSGINIGLDPDTSLRLVIQTFLGAAYLARESDLPLSGLREMVTSPGGTTAAGLGVFEDMGLEDMIKKAVKAAYDRAMELGKD